MKYINNLISIFLSRMEQMIKIIINMILREDRVSLKSTETLCRYCWLLWIKRNSRRFHFESTRYELKLFKKWCEINTLFFYEANNLYIYLPFPCKGGSGIRRAPHLLPWYFLPHPLLFFFTSEDSHPIPPTLSYQPPLFVSFITTNQHTL